MRAHLIVHPTKSFSPPFDQVAYYLLVHLIVFINSCLCIIYRVPSTYTMTLTVPSSFNLDN